MNKVKEYYERSVEEDRLVKDKKHQTEYFITMEYINKYLKTGMRILEVGAGTGAYSIILAQNGYDVTAVELADKNVEILKSKGEKLSNIQVIQGNATDLSFLEDSYFDMVLCFGPLYHLDYQNRVKAMLECKRVCKADGIMFFAYLSNNFAIMKCFELYGNYIGDSKVLDSQFKLHDNIFYFSDVKEMDRISEMIDIYKVSVVATDGISELVKANVNLFSEQEFEVWKRYLLKTCTNPYQLDYSEHLLYIARKHRKHVIVAGACRAGKTTLSKSLSDLGFIHYKMDAVKRAVYKVFDFDKKDDWSTLSSKIIQIVESIIDDNSADDSHERFVIDTPYIYPKDLVNIDREKFVVIFIGYSQTTPEEKLNIIRQNDSKNCWTNSVSDNEMLKQSEMSIEYSKVVKKQCKEIGFAYFDTSTNFTETLEEAREYIEENI